MRFITIVSVPKKRSRLMKIITSLSALEPGDKQIYFWAGKYQIPQKESNLSYIPLLYGFKRNILKKLFGYVLWYIKVFVLSMKDNKELNYCLGFHAAFPVFVASLINNRVCFIFDDHDALSQSYRWKFGLIRLIRWIERKISKRARAHIIPSTSRNFGYQGNILILPNHVSRNSLNNAIQRYTLIKDKYKNMLVLYANGWLVETRGMHLIESLDEQEFENTIKILIAGNIYDDQFKHKILKSPIVEYLGNLSPEDALSYYFASDVVLTFYDPKITINRKAEPNKWQDCIATNTPFISNWGIDTLKPFLENESCFAVDYESKKDLTILVHSLLNDRTLLQKKKLNLAKHDVLYFEDVFLVLWRKIDISR
jgi:hypothetical protein